MLAATCLGDLILAAPSATPPAPLPPPPVRLDARAIFDPVTVVAAFDAYAASAAIQTTGIRLDTHADIGVTTSVAAIRAHAARAVTDAFVTRAAFDEG